MALSIGLLLFVFSAGITSLDSAQIKEALRESAITAQLEEVTRRPEVPLTSSPTPSPSRSPSPLLEESGSSTWLLATTVTRIGSVLILLFLVQIFVTLYRYNVRLSAYYNARADSLELLGHIDGDLRTLVNAFSPDAVDFGKLPRTPVEHALPLAKEIARGSQKLKD